MNRCIRLEGDPHVVWRAEFVQVFVLDFLHLCLDAFNLLDVCSLESFCALLKLVEHPAVVKAKVNINNLTFVNLKLASHLLNQGFLEFHDWHDLGVFLWKRLREVSIDLRVELRLRRVIIDRFQLQF